MAQTPLAVTALTIPDILSLYCFHRLHELHSFFISQKTAEAVEAALEDMALFEEDAQYLLFQYINLNLGGFPLITQGQQKL